MSISSDEINYLIYRYLQENGFSHSAFTFAYESLVARSSIAQADVPPGALITFLQKGLEYVAVEEHINEDGSIREFDNNYTLLSPFVCEAVAAKEEKKIRRTASHSSVISDVTGLLMGGDDSAGDGVDSSGVPHGASIVNIKHDTENRWLHIMGHQGEVFMCVWNPTHNQLASGSADGICRLWGLSDMSAGSERWTANAVPIRSAYMPHAAFPGEKFKDVTSVTWSPDGQHLATGCYDGMARIWDNTGSLKFNLQEHAGPVFSLKWNKRGNYVLSGSYDKRAIVWNAETGKLVKAFMLHSAAVLDVDWKDENTFATCSSDQNIHVCKVNGPDNKAIRTFSGHEDEVNAICWSPGGVYLASCSDDSTAKIWSLDGGDAVTGLVHNLQGHLKEIYTVRWTPTGPNSSNTSLPLLLCTASFDGTVKVWNAETGKVVHNLHKQSQPVYSIAPSPNGEYLASGSLGGHVLVWHVRTATLVRELHGNGDTFDVSWSHDGTMLCSCFSSGVVDVLDVSTQASGANVSVVPFAATVHEEEEPEQQDDVKLEEEREREDLDQSQEQHQLEECGEGAAAKTSSSSSSSSSSSGKSDDAATTAGDEAAPTDADDEGSIVVKMEVSDGGDNSSSDVNDINSLEQSEASPAPPPVIVAASSSPSPTAVILSSDENNRTVEATSDSSNGADSDPAADTIEANTAEMTNDAESL